MRDYEAELTEAVRCLASEAHFLNNDEALNTAFERVRGIRRDWAVFRRQVELSKELVAEVTAPLDLEAIKGAARDDSWIPARMALALLAEVERLRGGIARQVMAWEAEGLDLVAQSLREVLDPGMAPQVG